MTLLLNEPSSFFSILVLLTVSCNLQPSLVQTHSQSCLGDSNIKKNDLDLAGLRHSPLHSVIYFLEE